MLAGPMFRNFTPSRIDSSTKASAFSLAFCALAKKQNTKPTQIIKEKRDLAIFLITVFSSFVFCFVNYHTR